MTTANGDESMEGETHLPVPAIDQSVTEDMQRLLLRAQEGDLTALPELRTLLATRRDLWVQVGDLARHAELTQLQLIGRKNLLVKEAAQRKLAELKADLAGPSPTPLEKLLVDRIGVCWLQVHHLDVDACHTLAKDKGTSTWSVYAQKRLDSAQRRYLLAVKTLAVVPKLLKLGEAAEKESTEA